MNPGENLKCCIAKDLSFGQHFKQNQLILPQLKLNCCRRHLIISESSQTEFSRISSKEN